MSFDDEARVFDSPELSKSLVEKMRECESMTDLLQHLLDSKPAELKFGRDHYLDLKEIEQYLAGICLKLKIHGYDDRAERLQYLYSVLSKKYAKKEGTLKILLQFLLSASQRPTALTFLELKSDLYSPDPDNEDSGHDDESAAQKALLLELLKEDDKTGLNYSSDSELSEWSTEDETSVEEISNNDLPPILKLPHSSSFGEFSDVANTTLEDNEGHREEIRLYWLQEKQEAEKYLVREIRQFTTFPLTNQPVISSRLVLQAHFGEYWEWKQCANGKPDLHVAFEEDVVREILWQFVISKPASSPVFTLQWQVHPKLMVASLSRSCFVSIISHFGRILEKLETLRKFAERMLSTATSVTETDIPCRPTKVLRHYAAGLVEISRNFDKRISKLQRELNRSTRVKQTNVKEEPACTTLLRLKKDTSEIELIVNLLYNIHMQSFPEAAETAEEPWFYSLRLASCLENSLLLEPNPSFYGVLFFLYCKCLEAYLDDISSTLSTMKWDEKESLFVRAEPVQLHDSSFWSECIQIRNYKKSLVSSDISPVLCFSELLPKVLNVLKTYEVLDQLQEDFFFTRALNSYTESAREVVFHFVEEIFSMATLSPSSSCCKTSSRKSNPVESSIDYIKHFTFIGLDTSLAAGAFRFLTSPELSHPSKLAPFRQHKLEDFLKLERVPCPPHTLVLDQVINRWFTPVSGGARDSIQKIFEDFKVLESLKFFQEITLVVREDFARGLIEIVSGLKQSKFYKFDGASRFQQLLNDCYPDGREIFSVDLSLDFSSKGVKWELVATPNFPLNLIVTPRSVAGYLYIGRQLHRIRKSVWNLNSLSMKDCLGSDAVGVNRLLILRFALINFCSSLKSFCTLKLLSEDFSQYTRSSSIREDILNSIRRAHAEYLESIEDRVLRYPLIASVIIPKVVSMSEAVCDSWSTGISQTTMITLEDTLKKCWQVINDLGSTKYSSDLNELSYHFGPPPVFL